MTATDAAMVQRTPVRDQLWQMLRLPFPTPDDACLKFIRAYAGRRLYVPRKLHPLHRLCELLGEASAAQLVKARGGEYLAIPRAETWWRARRNDMLRSSYDGGLSQETVANRYHLSRRHVQRILAQGRTGAAP